jgi:TonB family protein
MRISTVGAVTAAILLAAVRPCAAQASPASPADSAARRDPADTTLVWGLADVTRTPEVLNKPEVGRLIPRYYPRELRAAKVTGTVVLEIVVGRDGKIESIAVDNASDPRFGQPALDVASHLRFAPARVGRTPVRTRVWLPVQFGAEFMR